MQALLKALGELLHALNFAHEPAHEHEAAADRCHDAAGAARSPTQVGAARKEERACDDARSEEHGALDLRHGHRAGQQRKLRTIQQLGPCTARGCERQ
jgi:hypothetical protein